MGNVETLARAARWGDRTLLEVVIPPAMRRARTALWPAERKIIGVGVFLTLVCAFSLMGALQPALAQGGISGWFSGQPASYEECVLRNMRGVTSDEAARAIQAACAVQANQPATTPPPYDITYLFSNPNNIVIPNTGRGNHYGFTFDTNHTIENAVITSVFVRFNLSRGSQTVTEECRITTGRAFQAGQVSCNFRYNENISNWEFVKIMGRQLNSRDSRNSQQ